MKKETWQLRAIGLSVKNFSFLCVYHHQLFFGHFIKLNCKKHQSNALFVFIVSLPSFQSKCISHYNALYVYKTTKESSWMNLLPHKTFTKYFKTCFWINIVYISLCFVSSLLMWRCNFYFAFPPPVPSPSPSAALFMACRFLLLHSKPLSLWTFSTLLHYI